MFWNKDLKNEVEMLRYENSMLENEITNLLNKIDDKKNDFESMMRKSIGIVPINFGDVSPDSGNPPYFLEGLTEDQRKAFINDIESIYSNERFQKVIKYIIDMLGNHAIQKADIAHMKNGQMAIVGVRTLTAELEKLHNEFESSRRGVEDFDPLETLPE